MHFKIRSIVWSSESMCSKDAPLSFKYLMLFKNLFLNWSLVPIKRQAVIKKSNIKTIRHSTFWIVRLYDCCAIYTEVLAVQTRGL